MGYFRTFKQCNFPDDVRRIVRVAASVGYFLKPNEAEDLWQRYSGELCASWCILPLTDERLTKVLLDIIEDRYPSPDEIDEAIEDGLGSV